MGVPRARAIRPRSPPRPEQPRRRRVSRSVDSVEGRLSPSRARGSRSRVAGCDFTPCGGEAARGSARTGLRARPGTSGRRAGLVAHAQQVVPPKRTGRCRRARPPSAHPRRSSPRCRARYGRASRAVCPGTHGPSWPDGTEPPRRRSARARRHGIARRYSPVRRGDRTGSGARAWAPRLQRRARSRSATAREPLSRGAPSHVAARGSLSDDAFAIDRCQSGPLRVVAPRTG